MFSQVTFFLSALRGDQIGSMTVPTYSCVNFHTLPPSVRLWINIDCRFLWVQSWSLSAFGRVWRRWRLTLASFKARVTWGCWRCCSGGHSGWGWRYCSRGRWKKKSIIVISFHLLMNYIYVANNGSSIGLMHGGWSSGGYYGELKCEKVAKAPLAIRS